MGLVEINQPDEEGTTRDQVFDFIVLYKKEHDGNSPSLREIANACFLSNQSTVQYHLTRLEIENRIHISGERRRHIEIVGATWNYPNDKSSPEAASQDSTDESAERHS